MEKFLVVGQQLRGRLSRTEDKASCKAPTPEHKLRDRGRKLLPDPPTRAHCLWGFFKPERNDAIWPSTGAGAPGSLTTERGKEVAGKFLVVRQQQKEQLSGRS